MASVNFKGGKCHGANDAKALMRHSEKEERLKHDHANPDIDKSRTNENTSLYGLSYEEMCNKYDERIRLLDDTTNTNKRSDRVTMFGLVIHTPAGLPEEKADLFFADAEKKVIKQYGEENVIDACRHHDEKHKYLDHGEWKMSRDHDQIFIIPEHNGSLNGKWFSSAANMKKLNRAIDEMAWKKYHVRFMTGEQARHLTVEELKHASYREEQELAIRTNAKKIKKQKTKFNELKDELADLDAEHANKMIMLNMEYQQAAERAEAEYAAKKKAIADREAELAQKEQALEGRELKLDDLTALEEKTFWSAEDKQNVLKTARLSVKNKQSAKALKDENKRLKQDVTDMLPRYKDYARVEAQVRHRDETVIPDLKKKLSKLEHDVDVRDEFIEQAGLKEKFLDFCREIGYKVKEFAEEISHSIRMR